MTGAESFAVTLGAARGGDERAVATLWRELNPRILRYLRGRNYGDVDDIASEAWIEIARGLPTFEGNEIEFRASHHKSNLVFFGWVGEKWAEFAFIERLIICFFGGNAFHTQMLHDCVIQRLVAELLADLNHAGNLVGFGFAHEVGNSRGKDQNLKRCDAAFLINSLEKVLCDDAAE